MKFRTRVEEALKRAAAATAGRAEDGVWEIEREELDAEDFTDSEQALAFPQSIGPIASWEPGNLYDSRQHEADAVFIANARADVPDFARAILRMTDPGMHSRISLCVLAHAMKGSSPAELADAVMALLHEVAEAAMETT